MSFQVYFNKLVLSSPLSESLCPIKIDSRSPFCKSENIASASDSGLEKSNCGDASRSNKLWSETSQSDSTQDFAHGHSPNNAGCTISKSDIEVN